MQLEFLGWEKPFLHSCTDYLINRFSKAQIVNLEQFDVVLPTSNSGRRLAELLSSKSKKLGLDFIPPRVHTIGDLPELFYPQQLPPADSQVSLACWIEAIADNTSKLRNLVGGQNLNTSLQSIYSLSEKCQSLWQEVSSAGLSFDSIAKHLNKNSIPGEQKWNELEFLHACYLKALDTHGFGDRYFERIQSLIASKLSGPENLVLCGCFDLPIITTRILEQCCGADANIALVFAPEDQKAHFTKLGTLQSADWLEKNITIDENSIYYCSSPSTLASNLFTETQNIINEDTKPSDLKLGILSDDYIPAIKSVFQNNQFQIKNAAGESIADSAAYIFLNLVRNFLESRTYRDFCSLLRTEAVRKHLIQNNLLHSQYNEFLFELDRYFSTCLPEQITLQGPIRDLGGFIEKLEQLESLLSKSDSLESFSAALEEFFPPKQVDLKSKQVLSLIAESASLLSIIRNSCLQFNGLDLLLSYLEKQKLVDLSFEEQNEPIELLGWLELALDDSPYLLIASLNDQHLPGFTSPTPFLSQTLRKQLGLIGEDHRVARDSYALNTLVNSKSCCIFFTSQMSSRGDPLALSRLLLREPGNICAKRLNNFYREKPAVKARNVRQQPPGWTLPMPTPQKPIAKLRVSAFKDYLACPYLFYLRHILGLNRTNDEDMELSPQLFGSFTHRVLEKFPNYLDEQNSPSSSTVREALSNAFEKEVRETFSNNTFTAVWVQLELLHQRLMSFAHWQAEQFSAGWQISEREKRFSREALTIETENGQKIGISGIVDRIDHNPSLGRFRIIDYKTSENAVLFKDVYEKRSAKWKDPQLVLYAAFAIENNSEIASAFEESKLEIAYVNICRETNNKSCDTLELSKQMLNEAKQQASQIATSIYQQNFWPPNPNNWRGDILSLLPEKLYEARNY